MSYTPHTDQDVHAMLETIGANSIGELFEEIPAELRDFELQIPHQQSEQTSSLLSQAFAEKDKYINSFIGAGAYEHYIPAAVWDLVSRGEFMTAYTPYQAEASQGTLQVIFEYQTMMSELTGMEVSNASMYDGATALAEAVLMAVRAHKKKQARTIIIPQNLHPHYLQVVQNLTRSQNIELIQVPFCDKTGNVDQATLTKIETDSLAAVIIAQPNFFGNLETVDAITDWAHAQNALLIAVVNPISLAVLKPPGEWGSAGADIVVGEGQPLGVPLSGGGPYFGFTCCTKKLVRQIPGRIVGQTLDLDGRRGYTLTLQAREQHIRRSKATSNICTNQGLAVTAATIYMSLMGADGLEQVALQSMHNTHTLQQQLLEIGITPQFSTQDTFHETVLQLPIPATDFIQGMLKHGIDPGIDMGQYFPDMKNALLCCVTETKIPQQLEAFTSAARQVLSNFGQGAQ